VEHRNYKDINTKVLPSRRSTIAERFNLFFYKNMEYKVTFATSKNYEFKDIMTAFHYGLQCAEEKMKEQGLEVFTDIIKDIRKNEPTMHFEKQ